MTNEPTVRDREVFVAAMRAHNSTFLKSRAEKYDDQIADAEKAGAAHLASHRAEIVAQTKADLIASHAGDTGESVRTLVASAFIEGATAVHNSWLEGVNSNEADFGEAASDYVSGQHNHINEALAAAELRGEARGRAERDAGIEKWRALAIGCGGLFETNVHTKSRDDNAEQRMIVDIRDALKADAIARGDVGEGGHG